MDKIWRFRPQCFETPAWASEEASLSLVASFGVSAEVSGENAFRASGVSVGASSVKVSKSQKGILVSSDLCNDYTT